MISSFTGFRSISVDKKKLQKALELLQPSVPLFYEDNVNLTRNCKPPIYTLKDQTIFSYLPDSLGKLFAQIQKAVQQSDWTNLVKLLHIIVQRNDSLFYYPVIKSTLICLLSDPLFRETKFLAKFLEAVVFCKDKEEMDLFIKRLLEFPINLQNLVCHTQLSRR